MTEEKKKRTRRPITPSTALSQVISALEKLPPKEAAAVMAAAVKYLDAMASE